MPRAVKNAKLDTRSARARLAQRREPYWAVISAGCALGYHKGAKGGTWVGRLRDAEGRQHYEALGAADDARDPDGLTVFSFAQAQEASRTWFTALARKLAGGAAASDEPYSVKDALDDYFAAREGRGSKGVRADRYAADARITPQLGDVELGRLTTKRIRDWLTAVASAPKLVRTAKKAVARATREIDAGDAEAVRARRATANRHLTILKAALNHAFHEGRIASDEAWRKVKPFREADAALVANLSGESGRTLRADAMNNSGSETPGAVNARCSYGIAQWNGDRQFGLLQFARATGGDPRSLDTQIGFVDHELKTQYPDLYAASRDPNAPCSATSPTMSGRPTSRAACASARSISG